MRQSSDRIIAIRNILDRIDFIVEENITDPGLRTEVAKLSGEAESAIAEAITYAASSKPLALPWVEAVHVMGRQILNLATLVIAAILIFKGHVFTQWDILLLGGPNLAYQLIKGKGK